MPNVPPPENVPSDTELAKSYENTNPRAYMWYNMPRPIEFRPVEGHAFLLQDKKHEPIRHIWIKGIGELPNKNTCTHQEYLAYVSDYNLLGTAVLPHRDKVNFLQLKMASLDHAMWFHRDLSINEWLLYVIESPSTSNARGFSRGQFFNQQGQLVASVVQEGLMRPPKLNPKA